MSSLPTCASAPPRMSAIEVAELDSDDDAGSVERAQGASQGAVAMSSESTERDNSDTSDRRENLETIPAELWQHIVQHERQHSQNKPMDATGQPLDWAGIRPQPPKSRVAADPRDDVLHHIAMLEVTVKVLQTKLAQKEEEHAAQLRGITLQHGARLDEVERMAQGAVTAIATIHRAQHSMVGNDPVTWRWQLGFGISRFFNCLDLLARFPWNLCGEKLFSHTDVDGNVAKGKLLTNGLGLVTWAIVSIPALHSGLPVEAAVAIIAYCISNTFLTAWVSLVMSRAGPDWIAAGRKWAAWLFRAFGVQVTTLKGQKSREIGIALSALVSLLPTIAVVFTTYYWFGAGNRGTCYHNNSRANVTSASTIPCLQLGNDQGSICCATSFQHGGQYSYVDLSWYIVRYIAFVAANVAGGYGVINFGAHCLLAYAEHHQSVQGGTADVRNSLRRKSMINILQMSPEYRGRSFERASSSPGEARALPTHLSRTLARANSASSPNSARRVAV